MPPCGLLNGHAPRGSGLHALRQRGAALDKETNVAANTFAQHIKNDMCPIATFRFRLPEEQGEFDAARLGQAALSALWQIDQHCRSLLKHGEPSDEVRRLAEEIRAMISPELLEA